MFGIQDGGWCAASSNGHLSFNKYGTADNCVGGKGGMMSFDIYGINCKLLTIIIIINSVILSWRYT